MKTNQRGIGRTYNLVAQLKPGDTYVVHNHDMVDYVKRMIVRRDLANVFKYRVVVATPGNVQCLEGMHRPYKILVDHAVWELCDPEVIDQLKSTLARCSF
jgi:hypothetical protein